MGKAENGIIYVGLNELTTWLDLTTRRVIQLVDEGVIPKEGKGRYPLKQCVLGYLAYLRGLAEGRGRTSELNQEKLLTARIERKRRELEYAEAEGSLITVESHRAALAEAFDLVRSNIRNLPGAIAPRLVGLDDARDVQAILIPSVDDALRAIISEAERRIEDDTLPVDLPGRTQLLAHGVSSLTDLLEVPDLRAVRGIGTKTEAKIKAWIRDTTTWQS
jgi:hypothetical protein